MFWFLSLSSIICYFIVSIFPKQILLSILLLIIHYFFLSSFHTLYGYLSLWGNAKQKWQFWTVHTTKSSRLKPIMNTPCIRGSKWGSKNIGWGRGGGGGKQLVKGMGEVEEMICRGRRRHRGIGNLSLPSKLRQHWYIFCSELKTKRGREENMKYETQCELMNKYREIYIFKP